MEYFPIGRVAELTGIAAVTLRAWERRYGLPHPHRTASGHRLYSMVEVALLRRVTALMESGYSISRAIERIRAEDEHGAVPEESQPLIAKWDSYRQRLLDAVDNFNTSALEQSYNDPLTLFPVDLIIGQVLLPVLERLGEEWELREDGIAREHFFSAFLRNKIGTRFNHELQRHQGPSLILACLPGEAHEMGLMLAGLTASARGFRVLYLGADLPLSQLIPVVRKVTPVGIALSGTCIKLDTGLAQDISAMCNSVDTPVYIGGDLANKEGDRLTALGATPIGNDFRKGVEHIIAASRQAHSGN